MPAKADTALSSDRAPTPLSNQPATALKMSARRYSVTLVRYYADAARAPLAAPLQRLVAGRLPSTAVPYGLSRSSS